MLLLTNLSSTGGTFCTVLNRTCSKSLWQTGQYIELCPVAAHAQHIKPDLSVHTNCCVISLRIGTLDRLLWALYCLLCFHRLWGISILAEELSASQLGLCSICQFRTDSAMAHRCHWVLYLSVPYWQCHGTSLSLGALSVSSALTVPWHIAVTGCSICQFRTDSAMAHRCHWVLRKHSSVHSQKTEESNCYLCCACPSVCPRRTVLLSLRGFSWIFVFWIFVKIFRFVCIVVKSKVAGTVREDIGP